MLKRICLRLRPGQFLQKPSRDDAMLNAGWPVAEVINAG